MNEWLDRYAFADMLWWKWQRMHDGMSNPASTFRGNREEVLLPFEEKVEDVFSVEEMGYANLGLLSLLSALLPPHRSPFDERRHLTRKRATEGAK